jgi:hypothetical protein
MKLPAVNVTLALPPITTFVSAVIECVAWYVGLPDEIVRFVRCRSAGTSVTAAFANCFASA